MAKSKKSKKILLILIVVLAGGVIAYFKFFYKRESIITVQTEKVKRREVIELVEATGKVQPVLMVKISPEVSGEIIELPVKEGQKIRRGDLLMKIKPDFYAANRNQSQASFKSAAASRENSVANLAKAVAELKRNKELFEKKLISESAYLDVTTAHEIARSTLDAATHQVEVAQALLNSADEQLAKTTIYSPLDGTVSQLNSRLGERVVGTATMAGTDVMTISDLTVMEARVDIGETDVVLIQTNQLAKLEVDSYKDRIFNGVVTDIANTAKVTAPGSQTEATKFEVKIRLTEKEPFRPGMSVTAKVETRYRTNVLVVPIQSVTTRSLNKPADGKKAPKKDEDEDGLQSAKSETKKKDDENKPFEVVFAAAGDAAKMLKVKRGISDDNYTEITEGLTEGQEVVSGGSKAINRELEDGKKIKIDNTKPQFKPGDGAEKK